jgi:hypothetical protein
MLADEAQSQRTHATAAGGDAFSSDDDEEGRGDLSGGMPQGRTAYNSSGASSLSQQVAAAARLAAAAGINPFQAAAQSAGPAMVGGAAGGVGGFQDPFALFQAGAFSAPSAPNAAASRTGSEVDLVHAGQLGNMAAGGGGGGGGGGRRAQLNRALMDELGAVPHISSR